MNFCGVARRRRHRVRFRGLAEPKLSRISCGRPMATAAPASGLELAAVEEKSDVAVRAAHEEDAERGIKETKSAGAARVSAGLAPCPPVELRWNDISLEVTAADKTRKVRSGMDDER